MKPSSAAASANPFRRKPIAQTRTEGHTGIASSYKDQAVIDAGQIRRSLRMLVNVGGIPFSTMDLTEATAWTIERALDGRKTRDGLAIRLSNAYCVALANQNKEYGKLLRGEGVNFPDGVSILFALKWLTRNTDIQPGRVRGPSFFENTLKEGRRAGVRHYLLGTDEQTLTDLQQAIHQKYPGTSISGHFAPPFGPISSEWLQEASERISAGTLPDIIWVAMGTPKQDYAAVALTNRLGVPCVGVGAAFDFLAGTKREAPQLWQSLGVEWLYRLLTEPKRLWRRYLIGNCQFLFYAFRNSASSRREFLELRQKVILDLTQANSGRPFIDLRVSDTGTTGASILEQGAPAPTNK